MLLSAMIAIILVVVMLGLFMVLDILEPAPEPVPTERSLDDIYAVIQAVDHFNLCSLAFDYTPGVKCIVEVYMGQPGDPAMIDKATSFEIDIPAWTFTIDGSDELDYTTENLASHLTTAGPFVLPREWSE